MRVFFVKIPIFDFQKLITMKKLLLMLPIVATSLFSAQKYEVSVAYGAPSLFGVSDSLLKGIGSAMGSSFFGESIVYPESNGVLNISATMYNNDMKWRYGVESSFESFNEDNTRFVKQSYVSVSPKVDYFWSASDKKLRFYSGVSAGVLFRNSEYYNDVTNKTITKENDTFFVFNIMPIGVRYGGDFGVFLEPNIGTRGFGQAGVSYIF